MEIISKALVDGITQQVLEEYCGFRRIITASGDKDAVPADGRRYVIVDQLKHGKHSFARAERAKAKSRKKRRKEHGRA